MQSTRCSRIERVTGVLATAFLLLVVPTVSAQVTGRVTDQRSGQPLAGVQVFIAGSGIGSLSQQNGRYLLLNVSAGTHTLSAQRIGYRTATVEVTVAAGETVVWDFALSEEALGLDQIIVTGTPGGTQRRAIGNSVLSVAAAEITENMAITDMQGLISGRAPGVQFTRVSGNVGTGSGVEIRGVGSFSLVADPLIYVDGVRVNNDSRSGPQLGDVREVNPLQDFNPAEIESIEIIKGPAAATLYGTEASAGVIQIITKKGQEGSPQFDVALRQGINFMRDPRGRLGPKWGCTTQFNPVCTAGEGLMQYSTYDESNRLIAEGAFDWPREEMMQTGRSQTYDLSVRGGTEALRYFLSASYDDSEGAVHYNWSETFRMRANLGIVFSENVSLDISTGYVDGLTRFGSPATGDGGIWEDMIWGNGYCLPRVNRQNACPRLMGFQEHLPSDVARLEVTRENNRFTGSGTINLTSGGWLASRAIIGLDKMWDENINLWPLQVERSPVYEETLLGRITLERPIITNISFDWSTTANFDVGNAWSTATSVGVQYYDEEANTFSTTGQGFPSALSTTVNQTPAAQAQIGYDLIQNKSLGFYVQEQVSWNDRLFLTAAIRADDNSAFGADFDRETYPKLSATWSVSEESFWNIGLVNTLRLRGAWGKAGRQPDAFAGANQYSVKPGPGGNAMLNPAGPGNPDVGPEVSTELEFGFDLALMDDRFSGEFSYFQQRNEDALLGLGIPLSEGFPGQVDQNLGRIDSWGWEALVRATIFESADVRFTLDFMADHVANEIKSLGEYPGSSRIKIGFPFPNRVERKTVVSAAFDPNGPYQTDDGRRYSAMCDAGVVLAGGEDRTGQYGVAPGGDIVDCEDVVGYSSLMGPAYPTYQFGVNPTLDLLNGVLRLHVMAEGKYGGYNHSNQGCGICYNNSKTSRQQQDPFEVALEPISRSDDIYNMGFWKLREVGLRWALPELITERLGVDRGSLSFAGRELWNIWQEEPTVQGLNVEDPESARTTRSTSNWRVLPPLTSFSASLRLSF